MDEAPDLTEAEKFTHCRVCGSRQRPAPRGASWHNLEIDAVAGEVRWFGCKLNGEWGVRWQFLLLLLEAKGEAVPAAAFERLLDDDACDGLDRVTMGCVRRWLEDRKLPFTIPRSCMNSYRLKFIG